MEVPKRRVLRVVYFYLKSNLPSLINDSDEGSDSVPGDGEMKKREGERELPGLFGPGLEERERELLPWLGRDEVGGGGDSCVLCSGLRC